MHLAHILALQENNVAATAEKPAVRQVTAHVKLYLDVVNAMALHFGVKIRCMAIMTDRTRAIFTVLGLWQRDR